MTDQNQADEFVPLSRLVAALWAIYLTPCLCDLHLGSGCSCPASSLAGSELLRLLGDNWRELCARRPPMTESPTDLVCIGRRLRQHLRNTTLEAEDDLNAIVSRAEADAYAAGVASVRQAVETLTVGAGPAEWRRGADFVLNAVSNIIVAVPRNMPVPPASGDRDE